MFTSFQPNENTSERIVFGDNSKGEILGLGKIAISNDNQFPMYYLWIRWDTICYLFHNFVRWVTIFSLRIRVWKSLEGWIPLLSLRVN
jgi:hypothetical protein